MSTTQVLRSRFPQGIARAEKFVSGPSRYLDSIGHVAWFIVNAMGSIGHALRYYRKETLRLIAEIGMGTGAMAVIGGTSAIVGFVSLSGSSLVAIQGFASLGNIGVEAFTGFFAAMINVRSAAPLVSGVALAAGAGGGATAELGAMRISEEIDALEVMGIKSISYLVSTRIMAGFVVIIPLYAMAMILSFLSGQVTTTLFYGQSTGTYEHYFSTFLRPEDVFWSFMDAIIISVIVMLNHCYYGFYASGGPVGVGEAVGRAMRASLVAVALVVLFVALGLYGVDPNFNLTVYPMTAPLNASRTPPYKLAGLVLALIFIAAIVLAFMQFRGDFLKREKLTMISSRAGLSMDPGAKVTYNGVEIGGGGPVDEVNVGGQPRAKIILNVDPKYIKLIPKNVDANITATTVFGNKYISFTSPKDPTPQRITKSDVIDVTAVTTEFNTLFETIVGVSTQVDPIKLNQTL